MTCIDSHTHKLRQRPCQSSMTYELVLISHFHFLVLDLWIPLVTLLLFIANFAQFKAKLV